MSTGKTKRRWWALITLLLASLVVATLWQQGVFDGERHEFRKESSEILTALTSGPDRATEAYEAASFAFRETSLLASFVDRADRLTQTLGTFERIENVDEIETLDTIRGKTARIEYELKFADAVVTRGELSYLQGHDGIWRLLGFRISVPIMMKNKVVKIDSQYERIKAPLEVERLVDQTLDDIAQGKGAEVRANASPPFQESTSEQAFATLLRGLDRELGPFQRRLAILSSGQNAAKSRAQVFALLQYEQAKTTGKLEFIKVDGAWRLLHFKVVIPETPFPARPL